MRSLPDTCAPATRKLCNRTERATGRYSNGIQRDVGVSRAILVARRSFCVQPRATTSMVMCCWLMVVGWGDEMVYRLSCEIPEECVFVPAERDVYRCVRKLKPSLREDLIRSEQVA